MVLVKWEGFFMGNGTIASNAATAGRIATEMKVASNSITSAMGYSISYANQTTLSINHEAQATNDEMKHLATSFNEAFLKTIENLQSVEEEFTKTDQTIGANTGGLAYSIE